MLIVGVALFAVAVPLSILGYLHVILFFVVTLGGATAATALLVFGRGDARVFAVGALFPCAILFAAAICFFVGACFDSWADLAELHGLLATTVIAAGAAPMFGLIAVGVKRIRSSSMLAQFGESVRRQQFSLAALMGMTAAAALLTMVMFVLPGWLSSLALAFTGLLIPLALTIVIVYGAGAWRAFCIGGLFPAAMSFATSVCVFVIATFEADLNFLDQYNMAWGMRIGAGASWLGVLVCGCLSMVIRAWLLPGNPEVQTEQPPLGGSRGTSGEGDRVGNNQLP
jgi:hypothetical protein